MPKNQSNEDTENHCEYLVDTANNYNEDENHNNKYESGLDEIINKVKAETKAVIKKIKAADKDLGSKYCKVGTK